MDNSTLTFEGKIILHRPKQLFYRTVLKVTAAGKELSVPENHTAILRVKKEGDYPVKLVWENGTKTQNYNFNVNRDNPIQYYEVRLKKDVAGLYRVAVPSKYMPAEKPTDNTESQTTHAQYYQRELPKEPKRPAQQHNHVWLIDAADTMSGSDFEQFCASLLRRNGFTKIEVTAGSGDHGADILATRDGLKYAFQCKRANSSIGNKAVQEVFRARRFIVQISLS